MALLQALPPAPSGINTLPDAEQANSAVLMLFIWGALQLGASFKIATRDILRHSCSKDLK